MSGRAHAGWSGLVPLGLLGRGVWGLGFEGLVFGA